MAPFSRSSWRGSRCAGCAARSYAIPRARVRLARGIARCHERPSAMLGSLRLSSLPLCYITPRSLCSTYGWIYYVSRARGAAHVYRLSLGCTYRTRSAYILSYVRASRRLIHRHARGEQAEAPRYTMRGYNKQAPRVPGAHCIITQEHGATRNDLTASGVWRIENSCFRNNSAGDAPRCNFAKFKSDAYFIW